MTGEIKILKCGNCEELKIGVHATVLTLAVVCGAYNTAAWLLRRDRHLTANIVLYAALSAWEILHVVYRCAALPDRRVLPDRREARGEGAVDRVKPAA